LEELVLVDINVPQLGDQLCYVFFDQPECLRVVADSQSMYNGPLSFKVIALNSLLMKIASFAV
jgi:hypothetical protein